MIVISVNGLLPAFVSRTILTRAIRETFRAAHQRTEGSVSLFLLTNRRIRSLNRRFRGSDTPTDVLSFAPAAFPIRRKQSKDWGEIFLAPAYIRTSARTQRIPFREEFCRVTIHGMLHLFGYHHATKTEERRMFRMQERALKTVV